MSFATTPVGAASAFENSSPNIHELMVIKDPTPSVYKASGVPYLFSNEEQKNEVLSTLQRTCLETAAPKMHIGFSGWFNFDVIVARKSSYAIIADIDPKVCEVIKFTGEILLTSKNPREFIEKIKPFLSTKSEYFYYGNRALDLEKILEQEIIRPSCWLSNDKSFNYIKRMFSEGRILSLLLDIRHSDKFSSISDWMEGNGVIPDTMYVSNISDWVEGNQKDFRDSISRVSTIDTELIYVYREDYFNKGPLNQEVTKVFEAKCMLDRPRKQIRHRRFVKRAIRDDDNDYLAAPPLFGLQGKSLDFGSSCCAESSP